MPPGIRGKLRRHPGFEPGPTIDGAGGEYLATGLAEQARGGCGKDGVVLGDVHGN